MSIRSSDTAMLSSTPEASPQRQALWPWIVMPLIVLVVFYILHYDVRPQDNSTAGGEAHSTISESATE
jgi:hypothetical protein